MPTQRYLSKTVLEAAQERVSFVFDAFENIICSVSGGKDSTVLAHLALAEAHRRKRKIGVFLLDEEVMYQSSVDQVEYLMSLFPEETMRWWLQIPMRLTNAASLSEGQLNCWEPGAHKIWMRPKGEDNVKHKPWATETETVANKAKGFGFYDAIDNFERCYTNTAFLVGLRAVESPNRWRAVSKNPVTIADRRVYWGTPKGKNFSLYPIYDWNYFDIWRYIHDEGLRYSKVYDYYFKKGMHPAQMRVSSLIHEKSFKSICELPEFEPKTYERLQKRVKGISLVQETGKSSKLFACRKLPKNFKSWIDYRDFLLKTYNGDKKYREIFSKRFAKHLNNEYVARQQCRQLIVNDYENNLPVDNDEDPRDALIAYYKEVL